MKGGKESKTPTRPAATAKQAPGVESSGGTVAATPEAYRDGSIPWLDRIRTLQAHPERQSAAIRLLGLRLMTVERGRVTATLQAEERFLNFAGVMHGGLMAAVLDAVIGYAAYTALEPRQSFTTIELKTNYLRAVLPRDGELLAEAIIRHTGRSLLVLEGTLRRKDGMLVALATASCMVLEQHEKKTIS